MTTNNNIKKFPRKTETLPENCANTESYLMQEILYSDAQTKTVPDLITGSQRNRRWGIILSMAVVPGFDAVTPNAGPTLLPRTQSRFFTADTVEDLKARVNYEIDKAISLARKSIEDPDGFAKDAREAVEAMMAQTSDEENDMN